VFYLGVINRCISKAVHDKFLLLLRSLFGTNKTGDMQVFRFMISLSYFEKFVDGTINCQGYASFRS
jgi:hypothetical protein